MYEAYVDDAYVDAVYIYVATSTYATQQQHRPTTSTHIPSTSF